METNFSIFKYPRGFIKILELVCLNIHATVVQTVPNTYTSCSFRCPHVCTHFLFQLFAILAFALLAGYNEKGSLTVHTTNDLEVSYSFKVRYSFGSGDYQLFNTSPIATGRNVTAGDVSGSYQSDAQFLVAMGVISFLYILAMCLCYPLWECRLNPYRRKIFYSVVRCLSSGVWLNFCCDVMCLEWSRVARPSLANLFRARRVRHGERVWLRESSWWACSVFNVGVMLELICKV